MRLLGGPATEWTRHDLVFVTKSGPSGRAAELGALLRAHHRPREAAAYAASRLRHTTAPLLKDLGVPVRDTMEILGHSRIAVTLEIYTGADNASRLERRCAAIKRPRSQAPTRVLACEVA